MVTIIQKSDQDHWKQEGFTVYSGDVILVDDYETQKEEIPAVNSKAKAMGHSCYRNYETLFTTESYFTSKAELTMMDAKYYTFPSYRRLRSVDPWYGRDKDYTSKQIILNVVD